MTNQASAKNAPVSVKKGANPIQAFQNEVNNLCNSFFGETLPHWWRASETCMPFGACPATDIIETEKSFKVTAELPGLDAKDVSITISEGFVTIQGKKEEETKEERKGYFRQERSYGEFQRIIALPSNQTDTDKAEAVMNKGLLTITVPKKVGAQHATRKVEIKQAA